MRSFTVLLTFVSFTNADFLGKRQSCSSGFTLCSPGGATTTETPKIGDSTFQNLFVDIVDSSLPASKRSLSTRGSASLCCVATLDCLSMHNLNIPFCYDKFTTNFALPDGSFGTVVNGSYTSANGDSANLETGDYTLSNGATGNIYSANPAAKPNTATLALPSQFTASGVGSAVPASQLGNEITLTFTTTFPETTIAATTVPASTITSSASVISVVESIPVVTSSGNVVSSISTVISTIETTIVLPATTVAATTLEASTGVVTTTVDSASNPAIFGTGTGTASAAAASETLNKNAGSSLRVSFEADLWVMIGMFWFMIMF